jgi:hypothetical protein
MAVLEGRFADGDAILADATEHGEIVFVKAPAVGAEAGVAGDAPAFAES